MIARTLRNHLPERCTDSMLTRIDHIGIACFDLDRTVEFYRATYGFEVFHSEVNEEQGVREAMLKINNTDDGALPTSSSWNPPARTPPSGSGWRRTERAFTTLLSVRRMWTRTPPTSGKRAYASCMTSPGGAPWGPGSRSCIQRIATEY
uniref:Glyoxalase/fosfomycin resistance/dioxygenase domain-containing protein n=1 Tax=Streptomyces avermitilis TaxID=33903 RepID=A0A499VVW0_STRAX|nr:hypothetical protein SAVMC3_33060 [Streptomyces avermitilis]